MSGGEFVLVGVGDGSGSIFGVGVGPGRGSSGGAMAVAADELNRSAVGEPANRFHVERVIQFDGAGVPRTLSQRDKLGMRCFEVHNMVGELGVSRPRALQFAVARCASLIG